MPFCPWAAGPQFLCGVFYVLCGWSWRFSVHPVELLSRQTILEGNKSKSVNLRSLQRRDQEVGLDKPEINSRKRKKKNHGKSRKTSFT